MMVFIFGYRREKRGSTQGCYGATTACRVHVCDANEITTANPNATRTIVRGKVGEQLNELAVDVDGNEAISVRIETRHGASFVFYCALERLRGTRFKAEKEAPERSHDERLERDGADECNAKAKWLAKRLRREPDCAETNHHGEEQARGKQGTPAPAG
jgi:hypothetical protein